MAALHRPALPAPRVLGKVRSTKLILYLAGALIVAIALLQVNEFSRMTSTGYEVESLKRVRDLQLAENHKLEAEVASLSSLARIDWVARTEMKMEPPRRRLHIAVNQPVPLDQSLPTRFSPPPVPAHEQPSDDQPLWQRAIGLVNPF